MPPSPIHRTWSEPGALYSPTLSSKRASRKPIIERRVGIRAASHAASPVVPAFDDGGMEGRGEHARRAMPACVARRTCVAQRREDLRGCAWGRGRVAREEGVDCATDPRSVSRHSQLFAAAISTLASLPFSAGHAWKTLGSHPPLSSLPSHPLTDAPGRRWGPSGQRLRWRRTRHSPEDGGGGGGRTKLRCASSTSDALASLGTASPPGATRPELVVPSILPSSDAPGCRQ